MDLLSIKDKFRMNLKRSGSPEKITQLILFLFKNNYNYIKVKTILMVLIVGATGKIGKLLLASQDQAVGTTRRRNSKSLVFLDVESKDCDQATLSSKKFDMFFIVSGVAYFQKEFK